MVDVVDKVKLDALLKSRWDGLANSLAAQDLAGGIDFFSTFTQEKYLSILNNISNQLSQVATDMQQSIEMIYARGGRAKFRIHRGQVIDGKTTNLTFYIYFVINENGLWKIEKF
jgi:hypothetical protein